MVGTFQNHAGMRCDRCGRPPSHWLTTTCPRACGRVFMTCGRCGNEAALEAEVAEHVATCRQPSAATLAGAIAPPPAVTSAPSLRVLLRHGAVHGAKLGRGRGQLGAALGGVLGGVLGAAAGHLLNRPEMKPVVDLGHALTDPVRAVLDVLRGLDE